MTPAVFVGLVTDAEPYRLVLDYPGQYRAYLKRFAGDEVEVTIAKRRAAKTRKQEAGFHALITPWCQQEGHRFDDLKLDLLGEIFGWSEKPSPLTGRLLPLRQHTSTLNRADYSTLIERTLEIAAGCGVILEAPSEYRERKERERKAVEKAARKGRAA